MVSATLAGVIGTGLVLGIVHVLTGPDHLSALATLSVGKTYRAAFGLGVRWGCGHSFGLLIVAIIFFAVGQSVNIDTLTYYADMFVGFFMITLGVWYIYKAWKDKIQMESNNVLFEEAQMINDKNDNYDTNNSNNNHHATSISLETIDMTDKNINDNNNRNNRNNSQNNGNNSSYQTDLNVSNSNKNDKNDTNNNKNTKNNKNNTETEDDSSNHSNSSDTTTTASNTSNSSNNSNETHDSEVENNRNDENEQKTKSKTQTTKSKSNNDTNNNNNINEEEDDPSLKERTPSTLDTAEHNDDNSNNNTPDTADIGSGDAIIGASAGIGLGNDIKHVLSDLVTDDDIEMEIGLGYNEETKRSKCMTRLAAFIAGIFHGIAGPGGVLGVMVALKLSSWVWSSLYMFIFFVSSILTMGVYAIAYGYATSRMTLVAENKQLCAFFLKIISACFSIIVGVLWLALTFTGTLDKIFD